MPTYEYRCQKCQKTFDAVQSMKDERFTTCPENLCQMEGGWGKGEVTRLLGTGAGIIFKGSGFYITDYRSEGYKQAAKQEAGAAGGGGDAKGGTGGASGSGGAGEKSSSTPAAGASGAGSGASPASSAPAAPSSSSSPAPKKE